MGGVHMITVNPFRHAVFNLAFLLVTSCTVQAGEHKPGVIRGEAFPVKIGESQTRHNMIYTPDPRDLDVNYYDKFTIKAICIERMQEALKAMEKQFEGHVNRLGIT